MIIETIFVLGPIILRAMLLNIDSLEKYMSIK